MLTASTGYLPAAVSPDNITASAPSIIAFATSEASALVGIGFSIILSNIWVATITGFLTAFVFLIIVFWTIGNCSIGVSIPKSPLATMIPSEYSMISSIFSRAWGFSILEIILKWELFLSKIPLNNCKSSLHLTNDKPR